MAFEYPHNKGGWARLVPIQIRSGDDIVAITLREDHERHIADDDNYYSITVHIDTVLEYAVYNSTWNHYLSKAVRGEILAAADRNIEWLVFRRIERDEWEG